MTTAGSGQQTCAVRFRRRAVLLLLNERRNLNRTIIQNFDVRGGSANAHGTNWRVDLHAAGMGHLAGDERERPLGQTHQALIGVTMRIVDELIDFHARIGGDAE